MQDKVKLLCDSQRAIHLAKTRTYQSKTRHSLIKYHFVRNVINEGGVSLEKVHTKKNWADMFTKLVLLKKVRRCLAYLAFKEKLLE
jgi:hypothetical protein